MIARTTLGRRFVGRAVELNFLLSQRLEASHMRGRSVLVTGPAGIGKSRLLREFRAALSYRKVRIVEGACLAIARRPYAPILNILTEVDSAAAARMCHAENSREQLDIACDALLAFCERQTLVAVVEDLHWADAATLELVDYLTKLVGSVRLLLVLTSRSEALEAPRLARIAASDMVERIELQPLERDDSETFVDDALAGRVLAAPERARVIRIAEGNPFYIEELLKSTLERGNPGVPASLSAALLERSSALDAGARALVETAAVIGNEFDVATLTATSGIPRSAALDALLAACDQQMLAELGPDRFAFRHALTREALYASIPSLRAAALHRAAFEALARDAKTPVESLAHHAWFARDFAQAARYAEEAGLAATRTFAYEDATQQFARALTALEAVPDAAPEARVRILERRALAHIAAGSNAGAFDDYTAAADLLARTADREREAEMRVSASIQAYRNGNTAPRDPLEAMLSRLRRGDVAAASRLHAGIAQLAANVYASSIAYAHLRQVDLAIVEARPSLAYSYRATLAMLTYLDGDVEGYGRAFEAWLAAAKAIDGQPDISLAHYNGAMFFSILGGHARAVELFEAGLVISNMRRDRMAESATNAMAAMAYLAIGNLDAVRRSVTAVFDLEIDGKIGRAHAAAWGSIAAAHLGDHALMARSVDIAGLQAFAEPMCAAGYSQWLVRHGRPDEASALIHRAIRALERPRGLVHTLIAAARYGAAEDLPIARGHLERAAASTRPVVEAPALALFDALVARRDGDHARAAALALRACDGFAHLGYPLFEAQALETGGRLDDAAVVYRRCGALGDLKRLGHEKPLSAIPSRAVPHAATLLSPREREIAEFVALGETNRTIGERLHCSPKTVEKHLGAIFRKLGVVSRVQLAAWVVDGNIREQSAS